MLPAEPHAQTARAPVVVKANSSIQSTTRLLKPGVSLSAALASARKTGILSSLTWHADRCTGCSASASACISISDASRSESRCPKASNKPHAQFENASTNAEATCSSSSGVRCTLETRWLRTSLHTARTSSALLVALLAATVGTIVVASDWSSCAIAMQESGIKQQPAVSQSVSQSVK